ncbi:hypothetical protein NEOLI_002854 [Neolecta irregularis DAH-3]|uniref:Ubiquitin-like domain-containing protein n=1 Tax=Neolecta irregularis (strain DAH-3) TaxID=1198029 RepID=A0A1U7LQC5_NEOID|nr:hypothetical protein NEOLI_002854 [Neolecta irregularis DAH-3]|eukprot:OLL24857.1 hypothetical protein NEOLI_002854 [Neolecta irregularis DAH-3]
MAAIDEVSFAKSFLNLLDSKPVKLQSDHKADLRDLGPNQLGNAFPVLERKCKRNPEELSSATIVVRSLRPPVVNLTFTDLPLTTTIYTLRSKISEKSGLQNVKLLIKGKVLNDGKAVSDIVDDSRMATIHIMGMPNVKSEEMQVEECPFFTQLESFVTERLSEEKANKVLNAISTIQGIRKW